MSGPDALARALATTLPAYLPGRRWYGDKGRAVRSVSVADAAEVAFRGDRTWLTVVDVAFTEGQDARYFVPVAEARTKADVAPPLGALDDSDGTAFLVDAFEVPGFLSWLIAAFERSSSIRSERGRFSWSALPSGRECLSAASAIPGRLSLAEQSNTSIRFGDAAFVKVFRRLRAGVNPDEEIGRYLAAETTFDRFPRPLGTGRYVDANGGSYPVALAQEYVASVGDGWEFTLRSLVDGKTGVGFAPAARRLGERTGQLHAALAEETPDPAFAPEPLTAVDAAAWERRTRLALHETERVLGSRRESLPSSSREAAAALTRGLPELERRAAGFGASVGAWKTRVHGDYHLGQTLRAADGDWVILDFEGEPARSIEERRAKTSPLKDVAGMLRSFAYARGAAWRALDGRARNRKEEARLADWEAEARAAFLHGYRHAVGRAPVVPVPSDPVAFTRALVAWELDKALYEIAYELDNRPDWLDLPLGALLGAVAVGGDSG
ncbi:MAG: hypothetical protein M3Q10_03430 [Chloroflexota bacterium]|nr:hypothetical protein [Chloroflexota bacterium]